MIAKLIIIPVAVVVVGVLFLPTLVRLGTRALSSSEEIILSTGADSFESDAEGRAVQLVTLLGFDAIRAILDPNFVTAAEAQDWMDPNEQVLGLSINGEHRAYPISMLSRHEIVNDVVGGVPVAVTW